MHYIIYKTTNLVNGKFYIGKHQTSNLDDGYVGSGKLLKRAIKKYGLDQFKTEIVEVCPTEAHMNLAEKIYVVIDPEVSYNLCPGGKGGFGYINNHILSQERKRRGYMGGRATREKYGNVFNPNITIDASVRQIQISTRTHNFRRGVYKPKDHTGLKRSEHTKIKMSISASGAKNSQFGKSWYTNGKNNILLKKEDVESWIQLGYYKGRTIDKN